MSKKKKINWGKVADLSVRISGGVIALGGLAALAGEYGILICDKFDLLNTDENIHFYYKLESYLMDGGFGALISGLFLADYKNAIDDLLKLFRVQTTAKRRDDY